MNYLTKLGTALAIAAGLAGASASAETYRAAIWLGDGSPNGKFFNDYAKTIADKTGGEISFEVFSGGSLLPPTGSLSGLTSRVADLVFVTAGYIPAELPLDNVMGDVAFTVDDQITLAMATLETKLTHPKMIEEYKAHNAVYTAGMAIGVYNFQCMMDAPDLESLKGKKIRTIGSAHVGWMNEIGAVSVAVPGTEIYTGLQRGSIDCTAGTPLFLTSYFKLNEILKSINMTPMGSIDTGGYFFNADLWKTFSPERRSTIFDAAAEAQARAYVSWGADIDAAFAQARENGITIHEPGEADMAKLKAFHGKFLSALPKNSIADRGVDDPSDLIDAYLAAVEKYRGLLAEIDTSDPEQLADLMKREIYAKIDVANYGNY